MGCTIAGHKTFLLVCNIGLLFTGLSILVLGVKMKETMALLRLDRIEILRRAIKAVIATGFVITVTGGTGVCGSCYEILWLLCVHLGGLGIIVVMEFALGITIMVVRNTVENVLNTADCGFFCSSTLQTLVLDMAMPSAGIMMTIIVMEALMIYSGIKLFFYFRDRPKETPMVGPSVVVQNVQMQNVAQPSYMQPAPMYAPQMMLHPNYVPKMEHTAASPQQLAQPFQPMSPQPMNPPPVAQQPSACCPQAVQSVTCDVQLSVPQQQSSEIPLAPTQQTSNLPPPYVKVDTQDDTIIVTSEPLPGHDMAATSTPVRPSPLR